MRNLGVVLGILLLIAGSAIFLTSVVLVPSSLIEGLGFAPWTDGPEYLDGAVSIARGEGYWIHVNGEKHPSRYPFAYSTLMAGAIGLGASPERAAHTVNLIAGGLLLALGGVFLWRYESILASGLFVVLLATVPAFTVLIRAPMSSVPASLMIAISAVLVLSCTPSNPGRAYLASLIAGLSLNLHMANLLVLPIGAAVGALWLGRTDTWRRVVLVMSAWFVVGLVPLWLYNSLVFGSPTRNGYQYWLAGWSDRPFIDISNVGASVTYYWLEILQREGQFTTANLYGRGSYVAPAFVGLILVATLAVRGRRAFAISSFGVGLTMLAVLFYGYNDGRFLLPMLVLAAAFVAIGISRLLNRSKAYGAVVVPLVFAAVVGWPGSGFQAAGVDSFLPPRRNPTPAYLVTQAVVARVSAARAIGSQGGLVLTDVPPPYLHALAPRGLLVAALQDFHFYAHNPETLIFGAEQRTSLVNQVLSRGERVWVATSAGNGSLSPSQMGLDEKLRWQEGVVIGSGWVAELTSTNSPAASNE